MMRCRLSTNAHSYPLDSIHTIAMHDSIYMTTRTKIQHELRKTQLRLTNVLDLFKMKHE